MLIAILLYNINQSTSFSVCFLSAIISRYSGSHHSSVASSPWRFMMRKKLTYQTEPSKRFLKYTLDTIRLTKLTDWYGGNCQCKITVPCVVTLWFKLNKWQSIVILNVSIVVNIRVVDNDGTVRWRHRITSTIVISLILIAVTSWHLFSVPIHETDPLERDRLHPDAAQIKEWIEQCQICWPNIRLCHLEMEADHG